MSQITNLEKSVCEKSYIDENHTFYGMEQYQDPDDPILSPYDPQKEGQYYQYDDDETSDDDDDDDDNNIAQRMRRPYLEQTQQRLLLTPPISENDENNKENRKRKYSDISWNTNNTNNTQQPKRRKLLKKSGKDSPFFTQLSPQNLSNMSPINNKDKNNKNGNDEEKQRKCKIMTSDLDFLHKNGDAFFNHSISFNSTECDENMENIDNITWDNLVKREYDINKYESLNINDIYDIQTPILTPEMNEIEYNENDKKNKIKIIMNASENQKALKINEILRNKYNILPIIHSLDFIDYVIGDSIGIIRRKEEDMIKGEQIQILKRILYNATDRYKKIIFILDKTNINNNLSKHRNLGIGSAKKLDKYLQQISLSPRIILIECNQCQQIAETIFYFLKKSAKNNKNNYFGVPLLFDDDFKNNNNHNNNNHNLNEQKLLFLTSLPQIGYSEAILLLKHFNFNIQNIINSTYKKLGEIVPSLKYNHRHKFIKMLIKHKWQESNENDKKYSQYMQHSSAVKMRNIFNNNNTCGVSLQH